MGSSCWGGQTATGLWVGEGRLYVCLVDPKTEDSTQVVEREVSDIIQDLQAFGLLSLEVGMSVFMFVWKLDRVVPLITDPQLTSSIYFK